MTKKAGLNFPVIKVHQQLQQATDANVVYKSKLAIVFDKRS
jgi:hypothetical protein